MAIREVCRASSCRDGRYGAAAESLCPSCRDRLVTTLETLPGLYADCVRGVAPSVVRVIRKTPVRVGSPSPGGADIRSAIRTVLASWAGLVAGERGLTPPARDVPALARFLCRHVDWLGRHPTAGDLVEEIHDLARTARAFTWATWSDFTRDCADSREWGGVHFRTTVERSIEWGAQFGDRAYDFVQRHITGRA